MSAGLRGAERSWQNTTVELRIEQVTKRFGGHMALHEFSLVLKTGVLALLGPNGAGKSTLMNVLATVAEPTSGKLIWEGAEVRADAFAGHRAGR